MPLPTRLRWAVAQLGWKPSGDATLATVIDVLDLPGQGWRVIEERTWRTAQTAPGEPTAVSARGAATITAWRSFEQTGESRWLWVQVTPATSEDGARALLVDTPTQLLGSVRAKVSVTAERTVEDLLIPGADVTWALEQTTAGTTGSSAALYVAGRVGVFVFALGASGRAHQWTWADVVDVASPQVQRLAALSSTTP